MRLQLHVLTDLTAIQAKAMNKKNDAICVRQAVELGERTMLRSLRLKLGTEPVRDAATLASALWGRKRHAHTLYLFVRPEDLNVLHDLAYLAKLQTAFGHCLRRSPHAVFTLFLVPRDALALAV